MAYSDDFIRRIRSANNELIDTLAGSAHIEVDPANGVLIWCAQSRRSPGDGEEALAEIMVGIIRDALGADLVGAHTHTSSKGRGRKRRNGSDPDVSTTVRVVLKGDL